MRRLRWQTIMRLTVGARLSGGLVLMWVLLMVSVGISWVAVNAFTLDESRAGSEVHTGQQASHEVDSHKAYIKQFAHPGGTQWLPHSF